VSEEERDVASRNYKELMTKKIHLDEMVMSLQRRQVLESKMLVRSRENQGKLWQVSQAIVQQYNVPLQLTQTYTQQEQPVQSIFLHNKFLGHLHPKGKLSSVICNCNPPRRIFSMNNLYSPLVHLYHRFLEHIYPTGRSNNP
jgi:hypothetical protein